MKKINFNHKISVISLLKGMKIQPRSLVSTSATLVRAASNSLSLTLADAPKYVSNIKEKVIYKKINDLNSWYTKIIGLDEVKLYHDRVVDLQEKLLTVQERRREMGLALTIIRKKSNELHDQLHKVKRQDDLQRFLDLMRDEIEVLKEENEIQSMFVNYDKEEREIFTAFTNAIRDSHEKQRAQLEYTKYLGLVLSIVGSFLAFSYSSLRRNDLKAFIESRMEEISNEQLNVLPTIESFRNDLKTFIASRMEEIGNQQVNVLTKELDEKRKSTQVILEDLKKSDSEVIIDNLPSMANIVKYSIYTLLGFIVLRSIM